MKRYDWQSLSAAERDGVLKRPVLPRDSSLKADVAAILNRVRADGDAALIAVTEKLDGVRLDTLTVSEEEFDRAEAGVTEADKRAIRDAAANIERFHRAQLPQPIRLETVPGVECERISRPISRVGLYVPAGSAPLPSTALMLGIPAKLAECGTRVLCSPPRPDGSVDSAVLYAARICGVSDVVKLGGAQAVAALAFGTESVPKVEKIFGPGNAWVTAAKAQVASDPGGAAQDLPAGPSEVLVVADGLANPAFVAADLLSQAEHGPDSQVVLVTTSEALLVDVLTEVARQTETLSRREIVVEALSHSRAILVPDIRAALNVSNLYAPEHLILQIENPRDYLADVQAAGSVFLGPWAPESVGDYCSGTNHVLPTYGFARAYSSLGVNDFMRAMTVQTLTPDGLRTIGPTAERLSALEGLDAHGRAVRERLDALEAS